MWVVGPATVAAVTRALRAGEDAIVQVVPTALLSARVKRSHPDLAVHRPCCARLPPATLLRCLQKSLRTSKGAGD